MDYSEVNKLVEIDDTIYYCQGYDEASQVSMYREIDNLLECERDYIQTLLEELE